MYIYMCAYIYVYIHIIYTYTYIYIYMYVCMIFTTEGSLEVAIESWPEWDLNARLYILKKVNVIDTSKLG